MTTTIYRKISPVYGILNEKSAIEGIVKAQRNQEGDTDTVTVYVFLAKIRCRFSWRFYNSQIKIYRGFYTSLRYIRQLTVNWTKLSYWSHSKTKRVIPIPFNVTAYIFLAKHTMSFFTLSWFERTYVLPHRSTKPGVQQFNVVPGTPIIVRNKAVPTQTQQGKTFLVLEIHVYYNGIGL